MAPSILSANTTVLSCQVLSYDEKTVLVEAGSYTPMRYFLERGRQDIVDIDDVYEHQARPPSKRRKVSSPHEKSQSRPIHTEHVDAIPLAKVAIDLHFPQALNSGISDSKIESEPPKFTDDLAIPVISYGIVQDDLSTQLRLAHPTHNGYVLRIDFTRLSNEVSDTLRFLALPGCQKSELNGSTMPDRPASIFRCSLKPSNGDCFHTVRLEASVNMRNGISAFPAGSPVGREKVYKDYDLYAQYFPDDKRRQIDHSLPWTPQDFYESVHVPEKGNEEDLGSPLETALFSFQKRAVQWMLKREGVQYKDRGISRISRKDRDGCVVDFHQKRHDADGNICYCNPLEGIVTRTKPDLDDRNLLGGLLAEEMGLGKTVELMALISLHPRPELVPGKILDIESHTKAYPSKATLIITPSTILQQWRTELSRHAPSLKVYHYDGIGSKRTKSADEVELLQVMSSHYDVVLTTYHTLTKEVHFATDPPQRNMRHQRQYERKRSPLIQIQWWRVCLDEAQMVESGVTAAARVARCLPRINSWAVSGTPVKKNVEDLHGLLLFLRMKPFDGNRKLWDHLVINHRHLFRQIFQTIALRHTKAQIREDIHLPAQKRVVITVPFTAVENQYYATLFKEMCDTVGVDIDGSPGSIHWNPENPRTVEAMRTWLIRLRQACLHPQVGGRNRKALGRGQGPLRTVDEVLNIMIDQNETNLRVEERAVIQSQLIRAHIVGNSREDEDRSEKALLIYQNALASSNELVKDARHRIEVAKAAGLTEDASALPSDDEDSSSESSMRLGPLRNNLRTALQLQHTCIYFAATSHYQIKVNETLTAPDSETFRNMEEEETNLYERAKLLRREILKDVSRKSEYFMRKIKDLQAGGKLIKMPAVKDLKSLGGIESRRIVEKSDDLFDVIRELSPIISEWRRKMLEYLTKPLVDEDEEGNEITGDEYEDSTKQQDELYVYFDAIKALQADLNSMITGEAAPLIDHEANSLVRSAKTWLNDEIPVELKEQPHAPELLLKLFAIRQTFRSKLGRVGSVRGLISEARRLQDSMLLGGGRAAVEGSITQQHLQSLQAVFSSYTTAISGLEKEIDLFRSTQNQRLDFYRQLQELSDDVAPYKEELDEHIDMQALESATQDEMLHRHTLAQLRTKNRFLMTLKQESGSQKESKLCVICQCTFENGVLTVCGHQYCKECIMQWWQQHRTCPVCKRKLAVVDFHDITYKPQELRVQEELESGSTSPGNHSPSVSSPSMQSSIYSEVDSKLMDQIKSIDLPRSYGTKIDTLARHILWIREHDPGAKSIVFSQFREFLDVLASAFSDFRLGYARLGRFNAVERFRHDPSIDCLLLDAKTDSSGLTLVNATHVFICEPLIQTAVELQAIARVHRIGQTRPTTVWMYLVNDTVEESIYEISVARRLAHLQSRLVSRKSEQSRSTTPAPLGEQAIDAANSEELQSAPLSKLLTAGKGGGELVQNDDLWRCLFGRATKSARDMDKGLNAELDRNLRAHAAEGRVVQALIDL